MAETDKYRSIFSKTFAYSSISFTFLLAKESGIFKTLINSDKPLTSQEIANDNNIRERYTREILGCLTSSELVRVSSNDDGVSVYDLEASAKEVVSEGPHIPYLNFVKILMTKYKDVKECLDVNKSGVNRYHQEYYDGMDEIHELSAPNTVSFILENVPGLKKKLENGIEVMEFGCGRARVLSLLASKFPNSTFTASEVLPHLMEAVKTKLSHIPNMKFEVVDICSLPQTIDKKYDWVLSIDVVHDLPHPGEALKGIRRLVESDGIYTFLDMAGTGSHEKDVGNQTAACLYSLSTFLCLPESFQSEDSEAHGANWAKETALEFARLAGFDTSVIPMDGQMVLYLAKPV